MKTLLMMTVLLSLNVSQGIAEDGYELAFLDFFSAAKSATPVPRNYLAPVTDQDRADITYIVNTLGVGSLTKIAKSKSSLKRAGDRVNSVHPLRFLECVFTNQEAIVSMHAMVSRGWVYGEFFSGLRDSLEEESRRNNIPVEYVSDFANQLKIDFNVIYPEIQERRWSDLMSTLLKSVPRSGDPNRYHF